MAGIYGYKPMPRNQRVASWGPKPKTKKPANTYQPWSASPYGGPAAGQDFGQNFLYPGGYNEPKKPVDLSTFFTNGYKVDPRATGGSSGGGSADIMSMIAGDWEVQDAEAAMGAGMARRRGDFQAGLRQALIDLGVSDTSKLGNLGKYIDADTISKAVQNKYSAVAQSQQQATRARSTNNAALAARGLLSSGQTTKSQEDVIAAQEGANYSSLRDFLSGGAAGLGGLADAEEGFARGIASARAAAAARAAEMAYWGAGSGWSDGGMTDQSGQWPYAYEGGYKPQIPASVAARSAGAAPRKIPKIYPPRRGPLTGGAPVSVGKKPAWAR